MNKLYQKPKQPYDYSRYGGAAEGVAFVNLKFQRLTNVPELVKKNGLYIY